MTKKLLKISQRLIKWDTDFPVNSHNGYAGLKELDAIIADAKVAVHEAGASYEDDFGHNPPPQTNVWPDLDTIARAISSRYPSGDDSKEGEAWYWSKRHDHPGNEFAHECRDEDRTIAKAALAVFPAPATVTHTTGIELAARFVEKRLNDYCAEHGVTDPDTGTVEYPGTGEEYVYELEEIIEGIRALATTEGSAND